MNTSGQSLPHPFSDFVKNLESDPQCDLILFKFKQSYALNVNLLLFLLWFATEKYGRLTKKELNILEQAVGHWHERVLLALRRVEAKLKTSHVSVLQEWLQAEVQWANQIEQQFLGEALSPRSRARSMQQQLGDACHNLLLYCKHLKIHFDDESKEQSIYLLQFIFPSVSRAIIVKNSEHALQSLGFSPQIGSQLLLNEL